MEHRHPIGVAARQTGISPHVLRIWERRYRAVVPERTPTGRRLYSDADIARLKLLKSAVRAGESIGQVSALSSEDLSQLLANAPGTRVKPGDARGDSDAGSHLRAAVDAVREFNPSNLEAALLTASTALGQQAFLERVVEPLLTRTGELWSSGDVKISQEHAASAVVRSVLGSMAVVAQKGSAGPTIVTTTPRGQQHELGALMAAISATWVGWRSLYLGPDLPAEEIAGAAAQQQAAAVALSIIYPPDDPQLSVELQRLRRLLDPGVELVVGGSAARAYRKVIDSLNARIVGSLAELNAHLKSLRSVPAGQGGDRS